VRNKNTTFIAALLIAIWGSLLYSNSLNGKFIWDDNDLVKNNVYIKSWSNIGKIFTKNIREGARREGNFYRPLQMLSYMVDYSLWKLNTVGFHLTNIILHILVALCVFWLIHLLWGKWLLSLFTGFLFAIHPIHTEAVSYISGRADPLAALFILLCFIFYIKNLSKNHLTFFIIIVATYISALLSKESSLIVPLLLLIYHYVFRRKIKSHFFILLAISLAYILLRVTLLKSTLPEIELSSTLLQRVPGFFVAVTNYIRLLLLPFNLHMEYGNKLFSFPEPKAIVGAIIIFFLTFSALKKKKYNPLFSFSILWFLTALLPVSNLYPVNAYMAEHWLYIPSIGIFTVAGGYFWWLYENKKLKIPAVSFLIVLSVFYSYLTIKQNIYWKEPLTFYERTLRFTRDSPKVYNNLANIYRDIGKKEEAIKFIKKAIEIDSQYPETYYNLGNVYYDVGENEEAIESYKKAIELNPNYAEAYNNLAIVYNDIGKNEQAIELLNKAIKLNPNYAEAYNNLGNVYYHIGRKEDAITFLKKAIELNPHYPEAYNNLGNAYYDRKKIEASIAAYKKALELNPNYAKVYYNLGGVYINRRENRKAITCFKKAIEINPNYDKAYNSLGIVYNNMGKTKEAIDSFKKALEINPRYAQAYNALGNVYSNIGKDSQAISSFKKAIEINPNYLQAYNNLGVVYINIGKSKEAITLLKKALQINPHYAKAYNNLAVIFFNQKKYKLAVEYCDKAIELGYEVNPEFLNLLKPYRDSN
jgi:tetratricopeptide (TPR) repeat protein